MLGALENLFLLPKITMKLSLRSLFAVNLLAALMLLMGCQPTQPQRPPEVQPEPLVLEPLPELLRPELLLDDQEIHRRRIADLLYEGLRALREDRLLTPSNSSAMHYFNRALALDPGNELALEGIQDIVARYLQLAESASRQGQFANAEVFLQRAQRVDSRHPGISGGWDLLEQERSLTHSVHTFNAGELRGRSEDLARQLQSIVRDTNEQEVFFLITAPNDDLGRWMYAQMQSAVEVEGFRLRGDIEIGGQPSVRVVLPRSNRS